jgi:hypothetical protein
VLFHSTLLDTLVFVSEDLSNQRQHRKTKLCFWRAVRALPPDFSSFSIRAGVDLHVLGLTQLSLLASKGLHW